VGFPLKTLGLILGLSITDAEAAKQVIYKAEKAAAKPLIPRQDKTFG
jgi:hypothetical protein